MQDNQFTSRMLTCAGVLMCTSGILMTLCAKLANGGVFFGSAVCMFTAAYHFRTVQGQKEPENSEAEHAQN